MFASFILPTTATVFNRSGYKSTAVVCKMLDLMSGTVLAKLVAGQNKVQLLRDSIYPVFFPGTLLLQFSDAPTRPQSAFLSLHQYQLSLFV
jgi:hypothetical protein